jgi:hypothetical protein
MLAEIGSAPQISGATRTVRSDIDPFRRARAKSDIERTQCRPAAEAAIALL